MADRGGGFVSAGVLGWGFANIAGHVFNVRGNVCRPLGGLLHRFRRSEGDLV
jgi:hypothetical protein